MEIKHRRSSTRHRISRKRSRFVVETTSVIGVPCLTETWFVGLQENAPKDSSLKDARLVFLGPDEDGKLQEVMAIETDSGGLLVIHARRIRDRYLDLLKGGL